MASAMGIFAGGIVGAGAAIETGDLFRYFGTAVFLVITAPLFVWKFVLAKRSTR